MSLPRSSLLAIYKSFVRTHVDYGDVISDLPANSNLSGKTESVQYNAVLALSAPIRRTSKKKSYQELGLESLKDRRLLRRMSYLYKIILTKLLSYLYELFLSHQRPHCLKHPGCFKALRCRTKLFCNSLLPFNVHECNKLDSNTKNSDSYAIFRTKLLAFKRPVGNIIYPVFMTHLELD